MRHASFVFAAWNGTNVLHGLLVSATGALFLCDVDAQSGSVTPIGAGIGFDGITALTVADGRLWGWDRTAGLIEIDPATGLGIDHHPTVGSGAAGATGIDALVLRRDGSLVGLGDGLYTIDPSSGLATLVSAFPPSVRIRGAQAFGGLIDPFGAGCAATTALQVHGTPDRGLTLTTVSGGHDPAMFGFLMIGLSRHSFAGVPLPYALGALGAPGCNLYTSIDIALPATSSNASPAQLVALLTLPYTMPCAAFYLQHAVARSNGRITTTSAVEVRPFF